MDVVYCKYTIKLEVLTDQEIPAKTNLRTIAYEIDEGGWSGSWETENVEYLTREQMAEALIAQGSDPGFLVDEDRDCEENSGR